MPKEIDAEAVLENCRALLGRIIAKLFYPQKKPPDQAPKTAELISGRRSPSIIAGADGPAPATLPRGSRLSGFLSEDTGSALKAGVKVCQRNLINEVPPLVTEYALNLAREGATPLQRGFQSGLLSRV